MDSDFEIYGLILALYAKIKQNRGPDPVDPKGVFHDLKDELSQFGITTFEQFSGRLDNLVEMKLIDNVQMLGGSTYHRITAKGETELKTTYDEKYREQSKKNKEKEEKEKSNEIKRRKIEVYVPILISIAAIIISIVISEVSLTSQEEENNKKFAIMNDTINYLKQSMVKSSYVYGHVQPHTVQFHSKSMSIVISGSGSRLTQGVTLEDGPLVLVNNETASFNVFVYNAGSNVAFINSLSVNVYPDDKNITAISLPDMTIQKPLTPNTGVIDIPYTFTPNSRFAPSGKLEFAINHDVGIYKYPLFQYNFTNVNPFTNLTNITK